MTLGCLLSLYFGCGIDRYNEGQVPVYCDTRQFFFNLKSLTVHADQWFGLFYLSAKKLYGILFNTCSSIKSVIRRYFTMFENLKFIWNSKWVSVPTICMKLQRFFFTNCEKLSILILRFCLLIKIKELAPSIKAQHRTRSKCYTYTNFFWETIYILTKDTRRIYIPNKSFSP